MQDDSKSKSNDKFMGGICDPQIHVLILKITSYLTLLIRGKENCLKNLN